MASFAVFEKLQLEAVFLLPPRPCGFAFGAFRTTAARIAAVNAGLPFVSAYGALPPRLASRPAGDIRGRYLAVLLRIPFLLKEFRDIRGLERKTVLRIRTLQMPSAHPPDQTPQLMEYRLQRHRQNYTTKPVARCQALGDNRGTSAARTLLKNIYTLGGFLSSFTSAFTKSTLIH